MSDEKDNKEEIKDILENDDVIVVVEESVKEKVKEEKPQNKMLKSMKPSKPIAPLMAIDMFVKLNRHSRNYALLAGFEYQEKKHKRVRDTKENYAARLEEYKTK